MKFLKEIFNENLKDIKTPETLGLILILLLICKILFSKQFMLVNDNILEELREAKFVFQLIVIIFFILSIMVFFALIICTFRYIILELLREIFLKKEIELLNDYGKIDDAYKFFLGSRIAIRKVNSWFLVLVGYFYLIDSTALGKLKEIILNNLSKWESRTFIIYFIIHILKYIYVVTLICRALSLIKNIPYNFLYFDDD